MQYQNLAKIKMTGHVKIVDMTTSQILVDEFNAVNAETMSIVLANMLQGNNSKHIYELHFGNGGTVIDGTGNITYKDVEENLQLGILADLYNPFYYKVVDSNDLLNNEDETRNNVTINHTDGLLYTDVVITCTIEESQPEDNSGAMIFDEIGIKSRGAAGLNTGYLLTHLVFEPVEKTPGRVIQIVYTLRISL